MTQPFIDEDAFLDQMASERFTIRQLHEAFAMVADQDNWKCEIDTYVSDHFRDILDDAIPFMTGSAPTFTDLGHGKMRVQAAGYYAAIGA